MSKVADQAQHVFEIAPITPDPETIQKMSSIIVNNFLHDPMYESYDPAVLQSYVASNSPERLTEALNRSDTTCFAARDQNELVGAVLLSFYEQGYPEDANRGTWRIRRLHVASGYRRMGIAGSLLTTAENFVQSQGNSTIYAEPTPEAAPLFLNSGWSGTFESKLVTFRNANDEPTQVVVPRLRASKVLSR